MNNINHISPLTLEQQVNHAIKDLSNQVKIGLEKLTKIESYLYDDDSTSSKGVIATQRDHGKRLNKLENESQVRKSIWATFGFVAGVVGTALVEFIKWLIYYHKP